MQFLDRTGVGTLWSICKEKFALTGHTHNYAGSGSPGGPANSAIGVVDCDGDIDDIIQIGYAPPVLGPTEILYIAGYTAGDNGAFAKIKNITKRDLTDWLELSDLAFSSSIDWSLISRVPTATTAQSGIMSSTDKAKLDGIASGANNYKLPSATIDNFGGIKISPYLTGTLWPVTIDNNGRAQTIINGLNKSDFDTIGNIQIKNNRYNSTYLPTAIKIVDMTTQNKSELLNFPLKSGTLALTSDLSDACRFNFINSISECRSDRINFLLGFTEYEIDLSDFDDYPDGTILLINTINKEIAIKHQSGTWYSRGQTMYRFSSDTMYIGKINLVTKNNGTVHHYSLS